MTDDSSPDGVTTGVRAEAGCTRPLQGQVALVTGAAQGIGLAIAARLAADGAALVLADLRVSGLEAALAQACAGTLPEHVAVAGDIGDPATAQNLARTALERFGRIDMLVNNAGISPWQPLRDHPDDLWHRTLEVNLSGPFWCLRAVAAPMLDAGYGRIVNIASQMGIAGAEGYGAYCASKAGLIGLTKALARELAPGGVLVNCVAPGPVETPMLTTDSPEYNEDTRMALPVRRWGRPADISETVALLCGPGGSFYVGQVLSPNGGSVI